MDLSALRHNARMLQARAGEAGLMAVVKANGYGHGIVQVTRVLQEEDIRNFAVARPTEGVQLREAGIDDTILVFGAPFSEDLSVYTDYDLDLTVSSPTVAEAAINHGRRARRIRVHAKVETGMGRIGLSLEEAPEVISELAGTPGVTLAGIWTHFATADEPDNPFSRKQLNRFRSVLDELPADVKPQHVHAANTGALLTLDEAVSDLPSPLVRTGISLYGMTTSRVLGDYIDLKPVMRLHARITHVKTVSEGTPISYGRCWTAPRPSRIATLGVGYGDGYPRLCSNRAVVRINGEECPVVGAICMDMCMVDLGPPDRPFARQVEVGDQAVLFGATSPTLYDVADWAETIPYEICCGIAPRVPRRYVDETSDLDAKLSRPPLSSHDYPSF